MDWLKINGTDFNLEVGTYSLEEFKKEFKHSFCVGKTDSEIENVHAQLRAVAVPAPLKIVSNELHTGNEEKATTVKGKGNSIGKRSID